MAKALLFVYTSLQIILEFSYASKIPVTTKAGTFLGLSTSVLVDGVSLEVHQFLGIPYAEAPVRDLRFRKPVAKQPFYGVYDATYHRAMCPQGGPQIIPLTKFNISEDCLMLNIYAPGNSSKSNYSRAVIIYIHGGAFTTGGSNLYSGNVLSAHGNVIIVTINYRLSVFGFLSTGNKAMPGNFGLWDQHLAIKWVHENIAAFGGDPNRVVLLGQSAGSISAIYQALYPGNKGLFKGVIAESGTPVDIRSLNTAHTGESASFSTAGHHLGCSSSNPAEVVSCLRNKTLQQIMSGLAVSFYQIPFAPVVDCDFIAANPLNMLDVTNSTYEDTRKFFSSLDFIIGGNNMEGASYLSYVWKALLLVTDLENYHVPYSAFKNRIIPNVFHQIYHMDPPEQATDMIAMRYSDITAPEDTIRSRDMLLELSTDYVFTVPNLKTARLHSDLALTSKTFVYEFTSRSSLVIGKYPTPKWVNGASHGDETGFVFGFSRAMLDALNVSTNYTPSPEEMALSKNIMTLWSNFAKSG